MVGQSVNFSAVAVGDTAALSEHHLALGDLVRYAGASGDFHPLHHDHAAAVEMGMPGVIGHGMFSAGVLARAITHFVGVENLTHLAFRFIRPTRLGEVLVTSVRVTHVTSADTVAIELDCALTNSSGELKVAAKARAESRQGL